MLSLALLRIFLLVLLLGGPLFVFSALGIQMRAPDLDLDLEVDELYDFGLVRLLFRDFGLESIRFDFESGCGCCDFFVVELDRLEFGLELDRNFDLVELDRDFDLEFEDLELDREFELEFELDRDLDLLLLNRDLDLVLYLGFVLTSERVRAVEI